MNIEVADRETLKEVLGYMSDWFADHPQAAEDCRTYIEDHERFNNEFLDSIFGYDDSED